MLEELQIQILKPIAWIKFIFALVLTVALYRLIIRIIASFKQYVSKEFILLTKWIFFILFLLVFLGLASQAFYLTTSPLFEFGKYIIEILQATIGRIIVIIAMSLIAWSLVSKISSKIVPSNDFNRRSVRIRTLKSVIESTLKAVIIFTSLVLLLQNLGINATSLLASASVIGLAVSFGAQSLIKDVFNGFFILLSDQYGVGDDISLNFGAVTGTVEDINLRTTSIRDLNGGLHIIQNGQITAITIRSKDWARVVATVSVGYDCNLNKAIEVLKKVSMAMYEDEQWNEFFIEEPDVQGVTTLGADSITLRALFKVRAKSQYAMNREFNRLIKIAMDEAKINLPFPQRTLSFNNEEPLQIQIKEIIKTKEKE